MAIVQKRELQADGHYQVSLYDTETQKLAHRWYENQDGKKDGEEIECDSTGKVHRVTDWKNGKKDGIEIEFSEALEIRHLKAEKNKCSGGGYADTWTDFDHITNWKDGKKDGFDVKKDRHGNMVAKEYINGKCVNSKEHYERYRVKAVNTKVLPKKLIASIAKIFPYVEKLSYLSVMNLVVENGHLKHVEIRNDIVSYNMELRDGKEYDGSAYIGKKLYQRENYYQYKKGMLDGEIKTDTFDGEFKDGKFTGKKYIPLKDSPCHEFIPGSENEKTVCWQIYQDGELISNDASYGRTKIHIPQDGEAYGKDEGTDLLFDGINDRTFIVFGMKDGKRDGQFECALDDVPDDGKDTYVKTAYKDGQLDGEYVKKVWKRVLAGGRRSFVWREIQENIKTHYKDGKLDGIYEDAVNKIRKYYKDDKLNGDYTEFFDHIDGKLKISGTFVEGKKSGFWKHYSDDGKVLRQKYYQEGKDCTAKYNRLKKIASKHVAEEDKLSKSKDKRVVLERKSKSAKKTDFVIETVKDILHLR